MAMNLTTLKKAFRDAVSSEFAFVPSEAEITHTFSDEFEEKTKKLIKSQKKITWNIWCTPFKRTATVFLAIIIIFSYTMSVEAVRNPVLSFITRVYETFTEYLFGDCTTKVITQEYSITYLPEGFKQVNKLAAKDNITVIYKHFNGDVIQFNQYSTDEMFYFSDNEHEEIIEFNSSGKEIKMYERNEMYKAFWTENEYFFVLTYYGETDIDEMKEIISSVK